VDLVVRIAADILDRLDPEPPIDERMLASSVGIADVRVVDIPWAGCLIPLEGGPVIQVRAGDGRRRRRFSVMHEVGHTFLPGFQLVRRYRCDPSPGKRRQERSEVLCDIAASELLLPRKRFLSDIANASFGLDVVETLSDRYDASIEATARRLVDLWPEPALMVVLEPMTKPSERSLTDAEPRLRVRYSHGSGNWPFVPAFKSANDEGPLLQALSGELVEADSRLDGLVAPPPRLLQLSARLFPYRDRSGVEHCRVIAVYRQPAHPLERRNGSAQTRRGQARRANSPVSGR
jgi:hypothetical protein